MIVEKKIVSIVDTVRLLNDVTMNELYKNDQLYYD